MASPDNNEKVAVESKKEHHASVNNNGDNNTDDATTLASYRLENARLHQEIIDLKQQLYKLKKQQQQQTHSNTKNTVESRKKQSSTMPQLISSFFSSHNGKQQQGTNYKAVPTGDNENQGDEDDEEDISTRPCMLDNSHNNEESSGDENEISVKDTTTTLGKALGLDVESGPNDVDSPATTSSTSSCSLSELLAEEEEENGDNNEQQEDDFTSATLMHQMILDRAFWLVGLLVLQSMSSFIIQWNENLLLRYPVIVRFLTMLVGAGGNAGNQASVRAIRGLAIGTIQNGTIRAFLRNEFTIGFCLSLIVGLAGCVRAAVFLTPWLETFAITLSLNFIVIISILLGATLPLAMQRVQIDPAHSSTTIQVLMDISGVTITVYVCRLVLDSGIFGHLATADDVNQTLLLNETMLAFNNNDSIIETVAKTLSPLSEPP